MVLLGYALTLAGIWAGVIIGRTIERKAWWRASRVRCDTVPNYVQVIATDGYRRVLAKQVVSLDGDDWEDEVNEQALEAAPHQSEVFAREGRCTLGEAVVVLLQLESEGVAERGRHAGEVTWRAARAGGGE